MFPSKRSAPGTSRSSFRSNFRCAGRSEGGIHSCDVTIGRRRTIGAKIGRHSLRVPARRAASRLGGAMVSAYVPMTRDSRASFRLALAREGGSADRPPRLVASRGVEPRGPHRHPCEPRNPRARLRCSMGMHGARHPHRARPLARFQATVLSEPRPLGHSDQMLEVR